MKFLLSILFLLFCSTAQAATTYWLCGNSAGGNWSSNTIWTTIAGDSSTCSGGTGAHPVAGDTANLGTTGGGAGGGNVTLSGATAANINKKPINPYNGV